MRVKNVVKVMNFHALIRVDNAKKQAEKLRMMEKELLFMMDHILNNRNLLLDKRKPRINPNKPPLNIYVGSDYGFCSNYNSQITEAMMADPEAEKIIIGKKLGHGAQNVLLRVTREESAEDFSRISDVLRDSIEKKKNSSINIICNEYLNASNIHFERKQIYPVAIPESEKRPDVNYNEDFAIEGDVNQLLMEMTFAYMVYEVRICLVNSYAGENVMRQNMTQESLKKIEEREEEERKAERKKEKEEAFSKVLENFQKMKSYQ